MTLCSRLFTDTLGKKKNPSSEYQTGSTKKIVAGKQDGKLIKGHQRGEEQLVLLFHFKRLIFFCKVGNKLSCEL